MRQDHVRRGRLAGRRLRTQHLALLAAALLGFAAPLAARANGPTGGGGVSGTTTTPTTTTTTPTTTPTTTTTTPGVTTPLPTTIPPRTSRNPFKNRGMWIWVLASSNGGSLSSIIAESKSEGISTLMIKSGDGTGSWSQFTPQLVSALHAAGIRVCGWQYIYGNRPIGEAKVGAAAVKEGADCLLIDAEGEYEGKYVAAQRYIVELRQLIGARFPVGLAGFPYVDFHPAFPYSVFLGPGGAQYNVPQMYWKDIGTSVDRVYTHTYDFNRLYQRPIYPLGQVYNAPPLRQIRRFRQESRAYGSPGVSWWDWQEASTRAFAATAQRIGSIPGFRPDMTVATLAQGAKGDLIVWAQEHLITAGYKLTIDGDFGPQTETAVLDFQTAKSLPATGELDPATWRALLMYAPVKVMWTRKKKKLVATVASARGGPLVTVPRSASLRARRNELAGAGGKGWPMRPATKDAIGRSGHYRPGLG